VEGRRKRFVDNTVLMFPNLFTTGNLFCGFYSIVSSLRGDYLIASYLILAAALFDLVDGRVARWTNGGTDFGREYDSLSDIVSFGVAPAILSYLYCLSNIPRIGWIVPFLYVACGALRLAKFNVSYRSSDPRYFCGLPIPVAAATVASGFLFFVEVGDIEHRPHYFIAILIVTAVLMVSSVRYKSYKKPERSLKNQFYTNMVLFLLVLVTAAINPHIVIFSLCVLYIFQGLLFEAYLRILSVFGRNGD
jgi:CDP-diacylglycerol---serine O-phosphatidyltransferase